MSLALRILLVVCALIMFALVATKVKKSQMQTSDTIFWIVFTIVLILAAIFPGVIISVSNAIGVQSPANFVFLCIIAILLYKLFALSVKTARLNMRIDELVQKVAIDEHDASKAAESSDQQDTLKHGSENSTH